MLLNVRSIAKNSTDLDCKPCTRINKDDVLVNHAVICLVLRVYLRAESKANTFGAITGAERDNWTMVF